MTFSPEVLPLASVGAMRPVFMIVMGAFLLLTVWRMTRGTRGWTPRILLAGAFLLALGYGVVMPMYEAGMILPISRISPMTEDVATPLIWHLVKMVAMNGGWLVFGFGLALHAGIFETEKSPAPVEAPSSSPAHGPVV